MDKDLNTRKRKKSIDDASRNIKKSMKNGSGSDEEDEDLFSWEEYLKKCHAKAVPKESFKHVQDTKVQGFVPGMKLECMDRTSLETDTYWIATVVMASGPLLLLRYDGYDDDRSGDFWCDAASDELQPIGWCTRTNNILIPPAAIRHKESNWAKFLMHDLKNAVCAPEHLFHRRSDPDEENQLKPGLKLELLHADDPLSYWVAAIVDAYGLRLRLRLEGSENEADDVWVYFLANNVHQLGWGKKNNLKLNIPSVLKTKYPNKDWAQVRGRLLGLCNLTTEDASLNKALNKSDSLPKPHGFTTGLKLEAVNPKDPSSICAATVSKVASEIFFQVEIDSLISCGDGSRPSMWCSSSSRNIFPVGWCARNNIQLTPPPGYLVHPFRWQTYLEYTKSTAAPSSLFSSEHEIPSHEFDIGMKLEAVDQTDSSTMTVATVTQVVGRTMWVLLNGYKHDSVEHIYDVESFDLYPVGWCSMNGHPLLTPRVQRPPEENRRLASLRATRQREIKRTTSDSGIANATNTTNITPANNLNTDTSINCENVKSAKSALDSNNLDTLDVVEDSKESAMVESSGLKEETKEWPKKEEPKTETPEKKVPITPKGKYELRASTLMPRNYEIKDEDDEEEDEKKDDKNVEAVIDLTEDDDAPVVTSETLDKKDGPKVCIYVKKSCEPGPFLKPAKIASIPSVIGPDGPNVVLRQLVEQIVLSAHSSKQVLKLLASETDKMTISAILRTLRTKLSLCENLISLNRVALCLNCDAVKVTKSSESPRKLNETTPKANKPVPQEDSKTVPSKREATKEVTTNVNNKPAGDPVKAFIPVEKPVVNTAKTVTPISKPAGNPSKATTTVSKLKVNTVKAPTSLQAASNFTPSSQLPQSVSAVSSAVPEPSRSESPSVTASRLSKHITKWNVDEVVDFIRTTDCHKFADDFLKQEIDGRALTLLSLDEIHKCLGVTLGPAIKLHFTVQNLVKKHR